MRDLAKSKDPRLTLIDGEGNHGLFVASLRPKVKAIVIAADGDEVGWEHVSAHIRYVTKQGKFKKRIPSWEEMCAIKEIFFKPDECVVQFHPKEEDYINIHGHVLHLWRKEGEDFPMPPKICV